MRRRWNYHWSKCLTRFNTFGTLLLLTNTWVVLLQNSATTSDEYILLYYRYYIKCLHVGPAIGHTFQFWVKTQLGWMLNKSSYWQMYWFTIDLDLRLWSPLIPFFVFLKLIPYRRTFAQVGMWPTNVTFVRGGRKLGLVIVTSRPLALDTGTVFL